MIKVGTSGYSYRDWVGEFYPRGTQSKDFLKLYSQFFTVTEINSTYYRVPDPSMFTGMLRKAPSDFEFVVKLSKQFTHERDKIESVADSFKRGIQPLIATDRLVALLAQFPYSFKPNSESFDHLKKIRHIFSDLHINVEFRNRFWIQDDTFRFLENNNLGYVCVDMPNLRNLVPPVARATFEPAYVRFHGRVRENWWDPPEPYMRYDYQYEEEELSPWVKKIEKLETSIGTVTVFFNNHFAGQSAKNAVMMAEMLELSPPEIATSPKQMKLPTDAENRLF
ncbi:MAG: DUF72 domain-containing protein [Candidatus Acetothermia bacterium]